MPINKFPYPKSTDTPSDYLHKMAKEAFGNTIRFDQINLRFAREKSAFEKIASTANE